MIATTVPLTFQWPPFDHPQFDVYGWTLHSEGDALLLDEGQTRQDHATVDVPADEQAGYYLVVNWRHARAGKWTHHHTTQAQYVDPPGEPDPDPEPDPEPPPPDPDPPVGELFFRHQSGALLGDGDTVAGNIYVEAVTPHTDVAAVTFFVNDVEVQRERAAPYTLAGDDSRGWKPFDTTAYPNGPLLLWALAEYNDGTTESASIALVVHNDPPPPDPDPDPEPPPPDPDPDPEPPPPDEPYEPEPGDGIAELPRKRVDVSWRGWNRVIRVRQGESVQAAIDAAQPGDAIQIDEGVRTEQLVCSRANETPVVIMPSGTLLEGRAKPGRHGVKFIGRDPTKRLLAFTSEARGYYVAGLEFEYDASILRTTGSMMSTGHADDIILDRVVCVMPDPQEVQRSLLMHGTNIGVIRSYLQAAYKGADSQAILSYSGEGPYHIEDCYLAGAGENIMLGGATPSTGRGMPHDVTILRCHFHKPDSWRAGFRTVKNSFEIKFAVRVLLEANVFEGNWKDGQDGHMFNIKLSARGEGDRIADFTFRNNVSRDSLYGFKIGSRYPRVVIENNLFTDMARLFTVLSDGRLHLLRNTCIHTHNIITTSGGSNHEELVAVGNIWGSTGGYGVKGGGSEGTSTLNADWGDRWVYRDNGHIGRREERYPAGNRFVGSESDVLFDAQYRLRSGSPFAGLGADIDAILSATAGVVQ